MPVVALSWELGSDGDRIGRALAERLGARYDEGAVLLEGARQYDAPGARPNVPELAERAPSFWERLNEERRRYNVLLRSLLYSFAAEGNCVLLGYGGSMLLRTVEHVLKARAMAPRDVRVRRLMEVPTSGATPTQQEAEDTIRRSDRDRERYIRYLFNVDWDDPALYDVVLNTRSITPTSAVDLLATLAAEPEFQATNDSQGVLRDLALASHVEALLMHDQSVWVENLRVSARGGEVIVSGQVLADEDRDAAEAVARGVAGVQSVRNDLIVQPPTLAGM
jgi:cytidylate kinase